MSKHKAWGEPTHRAASAIIAPNPAPKLVRRSNITFLLQLPCKAPRQRPEVNRTLVDKKSGACMEEGEIESDHDESNPMDQAELERQLELWPRVVDAAIQFNRIAFHHYTVQNLSIQAYVSRTNACYAPNPAPDVKKYQDWAKLDLLSHERSSEFYGIETIFDTLRPKPAEDEKTPFAASELTKPMHNSSIIVLQMVRSNAEPWFDDQFGKDIRVMFSQIIQRNRSLHESLKSGRMEPIQVTLLKVYFGEDRQMGDIEDEMVGPWVRFSVKHIHVEELWPGLTDFTVSYLNLSRAICHGLPFKAKKDTSPAGGVALALFGRGCTHPVLSCSSASIELRHFSEKDTRISQLDCTCSHQACILDILDPRARALESALFEGYLFAFKPSAHAKGEFDMSDGEEPAHLYSHLLRVVRGKIYLFCLRQVEQLLPKAPAMATSSFAEYFRLNIIRPSILKGGKGELPGFGLLDPLDSHTTHGSIVSPSTGMASHHSKIPAIPLVAAETCWLSQILSKSMGDILYQEKVLASAHIQSIKRLFMSDSDASVSLFNKHVDELCPSSQERLAFDSDSLSIIHQQMFLSGLVELIKVWPQVWPNPRLRSFLRDVNALVKNRLNSMPTEMRNICPPLMRTVPPTPPVGLPLPFPHGPPRPLGMGHAFPKHMLPPPFPVAPGFRPPPPNHWGPDPYAAESNSSQAKWQAQLGEPNNLLYQYWMARKDENITLQPNSKRRNNDFDYRVPPKD